MTPTALLTPTPKIKQFAQENKDEFLLFCAYSLTYPNSNEVVRNMFNVSEQEANNMLNSAHKILDVKGF